MKSLCSVMAIGVLLLTGCARQMDSNVYSSSAAAGKVLEGVVVSASPIIIKDSDKLQDNTMGMLGGGLVGGVAGSGVGKGTGQGLAAVGGALIGATAGAFIQDKLSTSQGMQYVVRIDKKYINSIPRTSSSEDVSFGGRSVDADIKQSIAVQDTKTDLISVVQGKDVILQPGQRVLIVYNDDRPRLTPATN